jgi:hypothetical protein
MYCIKIVEKLKTGAEKFKSESWKECQTIIHDNDLRNTTDKNSVTVPARFCSNTEAILALSMENNTTVKSWESGDS